MRDNDSIYLKNKTMKNTLTSITVLCAFSSLIFLTGCQKESDSRILSDNWTLESFQNVGQVYTDGDPAVKNSLGKTRDSAAVVLLFKDDGTLYTKEDVEAMQQYVDGKLSPKTYWTDLATFYAVTKLPYATVDYVMEIPISPESNEVRYVIDYLRQNQTPTNERASRVEKKLSNSLKVATSFLNCDVLVGKWTNGNSYGHACIVYNQSTLSSSSTFQQHISATETFDAWQAMPNPADEIAKKNMSEYWSSSNIQYRYLLKPAVALTNSQKTTIRSYTYNQDPDTYDWATTLSSQTKWYCSKLVWKAYKQISRDIGQNPVLFVTPLDIAGDPDLYGMSF